MDNVNLRFKTIAKYEINSQNTGSVYVAFEASVFNGKTYYKLTQFDGKAVYTDNLISKNIINNRRFNDYSHFFPYEEKVYFLQID